MISDERVRLLGCSGLQGACTRPVVLAQQLFLYFCRAVKQVFKKHLGS